MNGEMNGKDEPILFDNLPDDGSEQLYFDLKVDTQKANDRRLSCKS
jgi:hypothetical protein